MRLTLLKAPARLISLEEAKAHCRVDSDDEDALIKGCIDAAVSYLDGYHGILRRCLVDQEWRLDIARPGRTVRLPFPDISAVAVAYGDVEGGSVAFDLAHDGLALSFGFLPGRPIRISFTAGFGPAAAIPPAIKTAALMLVGFFYRHRGGDTDGPGFPPEVDVLVSPYKVWRV